MPEDRAGDLLLQRARGPHRRRRAPGAARDALVDARDRVAGALELRVLAGELAVARLEPDAPLPGWAQPDGGAPLHAVVRTPAELSVVCADAAVPDGVRAERRWRALEVAGPLDLALTGVLASLAAPLADAGVAVFALATFDTDYVLVRAHALGDAVAALRAAGHRVAADDYG